MKERIARLETIRKLIKSEKIRSQDTFLELLQKEGFEVTQATLSRDLKTLKVGKVSDANGSYVYFLPSEEPENTQSSYVNDFRRGFISMDFSGNVVIVKTYSGHSDPVAVALDAFSLGEVLGTIAGNDNSVAVFLREGVKGGDFVKKIEELMQGGDDEVS